MKITIDDPSPVLQCLLWHDIMGCATFRMIPVGLQETKCKVVFRSGIPGREIAIYELKSEEQEKIFLKGYISLNKKQQIEFKLRV